MELADIIRDLGGPTTAAVRLGVKRTTLAMWRKRGQVPHRHIPTVAKALGVPAEDVWPELRDIARPSEAAA